MRALGALCALYILRLCRSSNPDVVQVILDLSNSDYESIQPSKVVINNVEYFTCEEKVGFIVQSVKDGDQCLWKARHGEMFLDLRRFSKNGYQSILEMRYDALWEVKNKYFKHNDMSKSAHKNPWTRITEEEFENQLDDMKGIQIKGNYEPVKKLSAVLDLSEIDPNMIEIVESTSDKALYKTWTSEANSAITAVNDSTHTLWKSGDRRHVCIYVRLFSRDGRTILSIYTKNRIIPQFEHFELVDNNWKRISVDEYAKTNEMMKTREPMSSSRQMFFPVLRHRRCCRRGWIT